MFNHPVYKCKKFLEQIYNTVTEKNIADLSSDIVGLGAAVSEAFASIVIPTGTSLAMNQVPIGAIDGINNVFDTTDNYTAGSLMVWYNGSLQVSGTNYTETGSNQFTMAFIPDLGSNLIVAYKY